MQTWMVWDFLCLQRDSVGTSYGCWGHLNLRMSQQALTSPYHVGLP